MPQAVVVTSRDTSLKIKIYVTIKFSVVLYWCEAWFLILREKRNLKEPRGRKSQKVGEDCIMRIFITCTLHHILLE
jgi:hypothetical protein